MDDDLQKRIEAVLFSLGKKVNVKDIMRMTKQKDQGKVTAALIELKNRYNSDTANSLMILQDGEDWKLTIKDKYIDVAKDIGIDTELPKTIIETLAVIAYKNPVLQSDVIKVRTNKAYDHLSELEKLGYITREKKGRTKLIKLAPKFFEYFDLPLDSLKATFATVAAMEQVIQEKEHQIRSITQQQDVQIQQQKEHEKELGKHNIYLQGIPSKSSVIVEQFVEDSHGMTIISGEKLGPLDIYDDQKENVLQNNDSPNVVSASLIVDDKKRGIDNISLSSNTESETKKDSDASSKENGPELSIEDHDIKSTTDSFDSTTTFSDERNALDKNSIRDENSTNTASNSSSDSSSNRAKKGVDDLAAALANSIEELMKKKREINTPTKTDFNNSKIPAESPLSESSQSSFSSSPPSSDKISEDSSNSFDQTNEISSLNSPSDIDVNNSEQDAFFQNKNESNDDSSSSSDNLKETDIFQMSGLSKETLTLIEERSDDILGLKHKKKIENDDL